MEDGELVRAEVHASEHPADYDQQIAALRDLLPKAKAFIVCLLVPDGEWTDESQEGYTHVVIGTEPGVGLMRFLATGMEDIVSAANDLLSDGRVHGGGDSTEG